MHNSATPLLKAPPLASPSRWVGLAHPWFSHTLRWVLFYTGWLSVIHLSMQHTWTTAGGLGVAAVWWVLLYWQPWRVLPAQPKVTLFMGGLALVGLFLTQHSGVQALAVLGLFAYVLGLSHMVHTVDPPQRHNFMQLGSWFLAGCHAVAISLALLFAATHLQWVQTWPWFAVLMAAAMLFARLQRCATHRPHTSQTSHICQPDPTMALMMAFLPLFSLWCATPWLNATHHLGLHLISMAAGQILMLMLLKRFALALHHPMWGHALCISGTGLIWATNNTYLMLAAMVLLSAGSIWTQVLHPLSHRATSIALMLGVLSISVTAQWAHTSGPDALGLGLLITSLIWTLSHMGLHIRSSYEQRRH